MTAPRAKQPPFKLTSEIIEGFVASLLSPRFDEPAPIPDCHREWWELCCSAHKRVAIAAPRGHAKSTAITKSFVLANMLFRTRQYALIISNTYRQAVLFLGEIKLELRTNDQLRESFEIKGFQIDREDDIVIEFNDGQCFRIMAMGSETPPRGLLWNGKRPDLVIGDDMENDEMVMNPERRDKFKVWFLNAVLPAMSRKGIVRIVGTILHMDAFLERLMPRERDPNTLVADLSLRMIKPKDGWFTVKYRAHDGINPEALTKVLWPVKWTKKVFLDLYSIYTGQGNPEGYYQEYLNRPIDPFNSYFRKDDFQEYEDRDYERGAGHWPYAPTYLAIDGAFSTKERRDYTALIVGSTDELGMLYIRHVIRDRLDTKEVVDMILRLQETFKFSTVFMGKGAYEKSIGPFLQDQVRRRGKFLHVEQIPEIVDKRQRAQSIRGRMRAGGVKFNKRAKWYPDFEQELLEFDRGTHDDQVDAMSLFGMYLDSMLDAPSAREIEDIIYDDEVFVSTKNDDWASGRSQITGY